MLVVDVRCCCRPVELLSCLTLASCSSAVLEVMLCSKFPNMSRQLLFTKALIGISGVSILLCWKGGDKVFAIRSEYCIDLES